MKWPTWKYERLAHTVLLLGAAAVQHRAQLAAGEWRGLVPTALFVGALSAFAGVASVTDRLRERMVVEGVMAPTVECANKLPVYLTRGRVLMALFALSLSAWVSLASLAWDCFYPYWRRAWRARHPLTY